MTSAEYDGSKPHAPLYKPRVFAYLDIIGFTALVKRLGDERGLFPRIWGALNHPQLLQKSSFGLIEISAFSDSIVISAEPSNDTGVVRCAAAYQHELLVMGLLSRGGISIGRGVHSGGIAFGEGMLKAYEIEQHAAVYPRVVVDPQLLPTLKATERPNPLVMDEDGLWYVDSLMYPSWIGVSPAEMASRLRLTGKKISKGWQEAKESGRLDHVAKWTWLARRHKALAEELRVENCQVVPFE